MPILAPLARTPTPGIAGANNVGIDTLLVLTGVPTPADLLGAQPTKRPSNINAPHTIG